MNSLVVYEKIQRCQICKGKIQDIALGTTVIYRFCDPSDREGTPPTTDFLLEGNPTHLSYFLLSFFEHFVWTGRPHPLTSSMQRMVAQITENWTDPALNETGLNQSCNSIS
jgi:hypothetical protein